MAVLEQYDKVAEERTQKIAMAVAREFERITEDVIAAIDFGSELSPDTLALLNQYASALDDTIYDTIFEDFLDLYGDRAEAVRSYLSSLTGDDIAYTSADLETMDAIINTDFDKITTATAQVNTTVRQEVLRGILLGREAQIDTTALSETLQRNIETEIRTGEMSFDRVVNNSKALDLGYDVFEYVGPTDKFNRPFCREHVGKRYTREEINAMDNGQGLPVFEFGGGYNCRHRWAPRKSE